MGAQRATDSRSSPTSHKSILGHEQDERPARATGALEAPRPLTVSFGSCGGESLLLSWTCSSWGLWDETMTFCAGVGACMNICTHTHTHISFSQLHKGDPSLYECSSRIKSVTSILLTRHNKKIMLWTSLASPLHYYLNYFSLHANSIIFIHFRIWFFL